MQLKQGPISYRDLSLWFGLKPDTFAKSRPETKQKKLNKLKNFCDFHIDGKKIVIDRVYIPEYSKAYDIIEENFTKEWGLVIDPNTYAANWQKEAKVDSVTRVGKAMHRKYPEVKQVAESSAISYTGKVKREKVGRNCINEHGKEGSCRIVYLNEDHSGLLSKEQMQILQQCSQEAYADVGAQIRKIDEGYAMREITAEEAKKFKGEIDTSSSYEAYQQLLLERLGFIPKKLTQIEWENDWYSVN